MNIRRPQHRFPRRVRERGAILIVALVFLILLTLLAIGASSGSLLQQRMVAATRNAQLATLSGDTALRGAEWKLWSSASMVGAVFECSADAINAATGCVKYDPQSPLYGAAGAVTEFRTGNNAWLSLTGPITYTGANGAGFTSASGSLSAGSPSVAQNPQYIIEDMGLVKPPGAGPQHESGVSGPNIGGAANGGAGQISVRIYRITARATGGNQNTVRVVQSTFDAQAGN